MNTCSIHDRLSTAIQDWLERSPRADVAVSCLMQGALEESLCVLLDYASAEEETNALDEERGASEAARKAVRPLLQARLQARLDTVDATLSGECECSECGGSMESQGRRSRTWMSALGQLSLRRRYSSCKGCGVGEAFAQKSLGLPSRRVTPRLQETATMLATTLPHAMACHVLESVCGVNISKKNVEDMVEERGNLVLAVLGEDAQTYAAYDDDGLPRQSPSLPAEPGCASKNTAVAYIEIDGVVPMTREEIPDAELTRAQRDDKAKAKKEGARGGKGRRYNLVGREVKNAVLYTEQACAREGPQRGCLLQKRYVSLLGTWTAFIALLWVELRRQRFESAKLVVILSDGAEWIRSIARWMPFDTLAILDLFHVKHRIRATGVLLFAAPAEANAWIHEQYRRIEDGQSLMVIDALRWANPSSEAARKSAAELGTYLRNNQDRMDYPAYRERGLRISSAAVESANFHVTGQRLKCQGMRWDADGARRMAALRADLFNGRWEKRTRELIAA